MRRRAGKQHLLRKKNTKRRNRLSKMAINMMRTQPRGGHIFNIDGAGSDGRPTPRPKPAGSDGHILHGFVCKICEACF
ncbi:hypothetical protein ACS0TY_036676 [Phlomoides rotata]